MSVLRNAVHFSNLQEIVGESVVAGLLGEGRLRRLCWTNADLSYLEIVIHRKLFKTYEIIRHQCQCWDYPIYCGGLPKPLGSQ